MTAIDFTARAFGANALQQPVSQAGHGFMVGDVLSLTTAAAPNTWVKAHADSIISGEAVGMVSAIIDVNTFIITQIGYVQGIGNGSYPFTPGLPYYLSASAGLLTVTPPNPQVDIVMLCFYADSISSGFFFVSPPVLPPILTETPLIVQTAHGFTNGQIIRWDQGTTKYVLSKADTVAHAQGSLMVTNNFTANSFYASQLGYITGLSTAPGPFTSGQQYWLSTSTAGALQTSAPSGAGQAILPCFITNSTTSGYFFGGSGQLVESGSLLAWNDVNANTVMSSNNGYFTTAAVNMTLPTNYSQSDVLRICSHAGNGFTILQTQSYHQIFDLGLASTAGSGGTDSTVINGASIELIAVSSNGPWRVVSSKGSFTYA